MFQNAILHNSKQAFWHEHLSGILLWKFKYRVGCIVFENLIPVIGHHVRVNQETFGRKLNPDCRTFQIYPETIYKILDLAFSTSTNLEAISDLSPETWTVKDVYILRDEIKSELRWYEECLIQGSNGKNSIMLPVRH